MPGNRLKTKKGKEKYKHLLKVKEKSIPIVKSEYKKIPNEKFTIVIFDIPEVKRNKRDWLRECLKNLDFSLVQRSVWIGKAKIPKEFIDDIFELKLGKYIHIFEVSKSGTLLDKNFD